MSFFKKFYILVMTAIYILGMSAGFSIGSYIYKSDLIDCKIELMNKIAIED